MSEEPRASLPKQNNLPRRRWLQFGLRTALWTLLVLALGLGWWRDRQQMQARLDRSEVLRQALRLAQPDYRLDHLQVVKLWHDPDATVEPLRRYREALSPYVELVEVVRVDGREQRIVERTPRPSKPEVVAELIALLADGDAETRARAACTLRHVASKETIQPAVAPLIAALRDDDRTVRWHAALALGRAGAPALPARRALRKMVDGSDMPAFAAQMLRSIDPQADVAPRLAELLMHPRADTRRRALTELTNIDNAATRAAWPALRPLLFDADPHVREAAMSAAGKLAPVEEALEAMTEAFQAETDEALRKHAATILIELDERREDE